jgi:hypothetical protein
MPNPVPFCHGFAIAMRHPATDNRDGGRWFQPQLLGAVITRESG